MFLSAPVLPLVEGKPTSDISKSRYRWTLYGLSWGILQLQGWLWGFLSCKGHVATVCTFPAHKANGLDPVVKPHALQNTPPHIDIKRTTPQCVHKPSPGLLSHRYHSHMLTNTNAGSWEVLCQAVAEQRGSRELTLSPRQPHRACYEAISVLQQNSKVMQQQCACRGYGWELKEQRCFCPAALVPS